MDRLDSQTLAAPVKATLGSSSLAGIGGAWAFLGEHHTEIGALCAVIGALCAVGGLVYTIWRGK